jgi:hypothetical protein
VDKKIWMDYLKPYVDVSVFTGTAVGATTRLPLIK